MDTSADQNLYDIPSGGLSFISHCGRNVCLGSGGQMVILGADKCFGDHGDMATLCNYDFGFCNETIAGIPLEEARVYRNGDGNKSSSSIARRNGPPFDSYIYQLF
jgi:hypothetical protein